MHMRKSGGTCVSIVGLAIMVGLGLAYICPEQATAQTFRATTDASASGSPLDPQEEIGASPVNVNSLAQGQPNCGKGFLMLTGQAFAIAGRGHLAAFSRGTATALNCSTPLVIAGGFAETEVCITDIVVSCLPGFDCSPLLNNDGTVTAHLNLHVSGSIQASPLVLGMFGGAEAFAQVHVEGSLSCNGPLIFEGTRILHYLGLPGGITLELLNSEFGVFVGFTGDDEVSSLQFDVPLDTPVTLWMLMTTSADVNTSGGDNTNADSFSNFGNTLSFSTTQPVFELPAAFTVDSADGQLQGNQWVFTDCNRNGVPDYADIAQGTSRDANGDGVPDECGPPPCPADLSGDGLIDFTDLTLLLTSWVAGTTQGDIGGPGGCGVSDGVTDFFDLTCLLAAWAAGGCP